jgi:hypothetical protein
MEEFGYHWTDFHKTRYLRIFRKSAEKTQVSLKSDRKNEFSHESLCRPTFMTISRSIRLRMRNVSDKIEDKIKTHVLCSVHLPENRAVCELMWKNIVQPGRTQMTILQEEWALHAG